MGKKYDVGILGVWTGCNYGSIATYYALHQFIRSEGRSVLMIDKPILMEDDVERTQTHARRFGEEHYHISPQYRLEELQKLNESCETFVIGSDQVWNYGISRNFGKAFYLDFAARDKKKIAYAASFGHEVDFAPPGERRRISEYMSHFDGISVREADGVRLCQEAYGILARQVLDPVLMAHPAIFEPLIERASAREREPYLAAYILDPTPEIREAILYLAKKLGGLKIVNLLDGLPWLFERNRRLMDLPNCVENLQEEDWLYYLSHADFILTDSCHGAALALLFHRQFLLLENEARGISRVRSLTGLFGLETRLVSDPRRIREDASLLERIPYQKVDRILWRERKRSRAFLRDALNAPKLSYRELEEKNRARGWAEDMFQEEGMSS